MPLVKVLQPLADILSNMSKGNMVNGRPDPHVFSAVNAGRQELSLITGQNYLSESYEFTASIGKVGVSIAKKKSLAIDKSSIDYNLKTRGTLGHLLKTVPFETEMKMSRNLISTTDAQKFEAGVNLLVGVDVTLDFNSCPVE